jgi:zinc transport system substrate-binding protein
MARVVGAALAKSGAADCLEAYLAELAQVEAGIAARLAPIAGSRFYVFHPAWGYFARDFGLSQIPIERHGKEPGPAYLAGLIDQARADGARVIIVQPQFSAAAANVVAQAIGADVVAIDPLARDILVSLKQLAELLTPGST